MLMTFQILLIVVVIISLIGLIGSDDIKEKRVMALIYIFSVLVSIFLVWLSGK